MSRRSFSWGPAFVTAGTIAVVGWIGYEYSQWPPPPPETVRAASESKAQPAARTPEPRTLRVALLTDSPPTDDSWFTQAMGSPGLGRFIPGREPEPAEPTVSGLVALVDRVSRSDWVVVQTGNSDVLLGRTSEEIAADVIELIEAVQGAGPRVVWATTAPLGADGAEVLEVNEQVTAWAQDNNVPVLDLFRAVGDVDGTYLEGMSDDGAEPNEAALQAQTRAARRQLPGLLAPSGSSG